MEYQVLLYYKFASVSDPEAAAEEQRAWCRELGLRGRIIVASEGINGTLSGLATDCSEYVERMNGHPAFAGTEFKVDEHHTHAFKRLSVKVRPEIVTLGVSVDVSLTGEHLSPKEFQEMLSQPDALVLDIRNDYEYQLGRFKGAVRPSVETFKEFPEWLQQFADAKQKPILTYCTGGIRCEKVTALLRQEGFEQVYQLHGGIVTYAKDPEVKGEGFEGDCFMFDDRLSVPVGEPVSKCERCGRPCARYVNCANVECNRLYFLCSDCEEGSTACSSACQIAERQRAPNARLDPQLRTDGKRVRQRRHRAKVREKAAEPHTIR